MAPDSYFAGLFDGEGTLRISFNGRQYQLLASLGMTDPVPPAMMLERFGGWIETRSNTGTGWKPVSVWRGSSKAAVALLDGVEEWLVTKAPQAKIAREFQAVIKRRLPLQHPEKIALYERMKKENKRGV